MLDQTAIDSRLRQMRVEADPGIIWDETCEGSARALVLFVGPSPGGDKPIERRPMNKSCSRALWNESFDKPRWWSPGFRVSWKPLVEAIFAAPYDTAGRLIGRANMDWLGDPESKDVAAQHMLEGAPSVLKMIEDCSPELVLPMDTKTFDVLKAVMEGKDPKFGAGFDITPYRADNFTIRISDAAKERFHRHLYAFHAKSKSPTGRSFLVIKLPQHPAKMFQADYATRCGEAIREAARQISAGQPVDVTKA